MKYQNYKAGITNYKDNYEKGIINDRILYQLTLTQDQFKTTSQRHSTQILDLFGDLGGFYQAIDILIFVFGEYFAAKLFI